MTQFWEIATIMSSKRVAVHLHEFPDDKKITPSFLYDKLGVEADVIFAELGAEDNLDLLTALYLDKFLEWEGIIRKPTATPSSDVFELITMPPTIGSSVKERGVALDMLEDGAHFHNDAFEFWVLPRRDLVLPFDSSMRCQLFNLTLEQSEATKCVAPTPYAHPEGALANLRQATTELLNEVEGRSARWSDEGRYIDALRRIDAVLRLQSRHWASRIDAPGAPAKVGFLSSARKAVSRALERTGKLLDGHEPTVAAEVLELLRDPSIRTATEQLAFDPTSLRSQQAKDISTALGDASDALSRSGRAVDFAREHVFPALKEACSHPSYGIAQAVAVTGDPDLRHEVDVGWESTLEDIQSQVGLFDKTPYQVLFAGAKLYKGSTAIVGSLLSPGTFTPLWNALNDASSKSAPIRMGGLLVRWLVTSGRSTAESPSFIGYGSRLNYKAFAAEIEAMRLLHGSARLHAEMEIVKDAQINRAFLRTRTGLGLNWVVSLIALLATVDPTDERTSLEYFAGVVASVSGVVQAGAKTAEYMAIVRGAQKIVVEGHQFNARFMGQVATVFSTLAALESLRRNLDDPSLGSVVPEYLQLGSGVLTAAGWGAVGVSKLLGDSAGVAVGGAIAEGLLGTLGVLLGFAALVWDMVTRPPSSPGTQQVLERYRDYLHGASFSGLLGDVDATLHVARVNGCFSMFEASSSPASGLGDAPPSWHDAHVFGLDGEEIVAMFKDTSLAALRSEKIAATFRGERGPSQK